jgi:predicted Zn-dependent protease with MMP-like domain
MILPTPLPNLAECHVTDSELLPTDAAIAPSLDDIARIGKAILADLPAEIRALMGPVPVVVRDYADEDLLEALEIDDALELSGLYQAVPIGERHAALPPTEPEMIFLFRMPIIMEWAERNCPLDEVVFDVLTHEIGHHLGMDEAAVRRMEER